MGLGHKLIMRLGSIIGYDAHFTDYYIKRYRFGIYQRLLAYYREQHEIASDKARKLRGEFAYKDLV